MAPKRKATKTAVAAAIETKPTAVISQDANEQIIETKRPNKKITSKKNAKPEIEVGNGDDVDISPKKVNQRPKRENAKKVTSYVEESVEETIEPVKKKSRGKKAPADSIEKNDNSENNKHADNNSAQNDGNPTKRTKKNAVTDDQHAVDKAIVDEKPKKAKSIKLEKEENEQDVEVQALKKKPRIKAEKITDKIKLDAKKLNEITEKTIDASPEKKSTKLRKAVKKEEKTDVHVKSSPAKKKKKQTEKSNTCSAISERRIINSSGPGRKNLPTARISTRSRLPPRPLLATRAAKSTSDKDNFSSGEKHEPPKELTVAKSRKRPTEDAKPNDTAVTKRIKNDKIASEDIAKPKQKMNLTTTDYTKINFESDKEYTLKVCSWNVAGLRALVAKNGFEYFEHEKPDIICLQEIKCLEDEVPSEAKLPGYHMYWCSKPGGRAGVALLTKKMPYNIEYNIGDDALDEEGRIITAEYSKFYLIVVYVPNAGRKLVNLERRLRWNKLFEQHVSTLKAIKPVAIVGDMNVAHNEIDLANPKTNTKNAGFSIEERNGMTDLLSHGFIDTFRHLYPEQKNAYTFWSYMGGARAKNVGWRLDYGIVTENLASKVVDNIIRSEILGSDHCPMLLLLNL